MPSVEETAPSNQAAAPDVPAGVMSASVANKKKGVGKKARKINKRLRKVSRALAKALAEEELRQYVYDRAMEKFDGETNVLWSQLESPKNGKGAPGKKGWNAMIKDHVPPGKARGMAHKMANTIDRAGKLLGGPMHLCWARAENFDESDLQSPLVTFTPIGVDTENYTGIVAYDAHGDEHIINGQDAAERPVVVLTWNERTTMEGQLKPSVKANLASANGAGASTNYIAPGGGGGGGTSGGGGGDTGDDGGSGDRNPVLYLGKFQCSGDYENWKKGDPEFKARMMYYNKEQEKVYEQTGSNDNPRVDLTDKVDGGNFSSDCEEDSWVDIDEQLNTWDPDLVYTYYWQWYEYDANDFLGNTVLNLSEAFKFKVKDKIEVAQEVGFKIEFTDADDILTGIPTHYNTLENRTSFKYEGGDPEMKLRFEE